MLRLLFVAALLLPAAANAENQDLSTLLQRIGVKEDRAALIYQDWSYQVTVQEEELDAKGAATSHAKIELSHAKGKTRGSEQLVRFVKDGQDVTAEKRAKWKAREEKKSWASDEKEFKGPFASAEQSNYVFTRLAPDRIGFAPKVPTEKNMRGEAVIDPATARIKSITMTPGRLPMLVAVLVITLEYNGGTEEAPLLSVLQVRGEAGVLFLKKRFQATTKFEGFAAP